MSAIRKKPKSDLRKYYTIFWEFGVVVVLILFIIAMKVDMRSTEKKVDLTQEQEVVKMKEVVQTQQQKKPPPPPRPQVPVAVPNDKVIEDQDINLDAELDLDAPLPEPPPQQQETKKQKKEDFFVAVEQQPKLKGGIVALQKKVKYPPKCQRANVQGRVTVQFIVNEKGEVEKPHVIRGIGGGCDQAAVDAINKYAHFVPGRQRGKAVRVQMSLPILFRLVH